MTQSPLSCHRLSKTFERSIVPRVGLQERVLGIGGARRRQTWTIEAVRDVSLTVAPGEWIGVYGPNGSGKTTMLKMFAGILPPDQGTVERSGTVSAFFGLGVGFHLDRTAEENIYHHGLLHGMRRRDILQSIEEVIAFAEVESHRHLPIKCFSTGMQSRIAFSAAMHVEADLYILDEVFAVGDVAFNAKCRQCLMRKKEEGKSAILVLHDLPTLTAYCHRVLHMRDGILAEEVLAAA